MGTRSITKLNSKHYLVATFKKDNFFYIFNATNEQFEKLEWMDIPKNEITLGVQVLPSKTFNE